LKKAKAAGATLVAFPELAISGYPPEDLILLPDFSTANYEALQEIAKASYGIVTVVGFIDYQDDVYNAAAILCDGQVITKCHKIHLPNYGVFDEQRYFNAGTSLCNLKLNTTLIGINICEDLWHPEPAQLQSQAGARIILNISASPYHRNKIYERMQLFRSRAIDNGVVVAYCNIVGGQDELVFDGASLVIGADGELIARAKQFEEDLLIVDIDLADVPRNQTITPLNHQTKNIVPFVDVQEIQLPLQSTPIRQNTIHTISKPLVHPLLSDLDEIYHALSLATQDYWFKNGFKRAFIGISGGIDSALTTAIAVSAIGAENITGVSMPSRYSSHHSMEDAEALAKNLNINFLQIPIDDIFQVYLDALANIFANTKANEAKENIQARIRGDILMALCNKFGGMALATNNKTELAIGHCALYGDMSGGYAVLKDIPKLLVYDLAKRLNNIHDYPFIPTRTIEKSSSAELRLNHEDENFLPPYSVLDAIVQNYVEQNKRIVDIAQNGLEKKVVSTFVRRINNNEYKRRQSAIGVKISRRAFGRDWRVPVTNRFPPQVEYLCTKE